MKTKETFSQKEQKQLDDFISTFSKLSDDVRLELLYTLPAYNMLLSVHATTFEELALKRVAIQQNKDPSDIRFSYNDIKPSCPRCGETERISKDNSKTKNGKTRTGSYFCNVCKKDRHFSITKGSIVHQTQCEAIVWMRLFYCLIEGFSVEHTCKYCRIAKETYYNLRNRLFYAMRLMLDDPVYGVKLYGLVQCDNMYENVSYKGNDLEDDGSDDDDPERYARFVPRESRKRGGSYALKDLDANSSCVFLAIDDHGHCAVRFATIGKPNANDLNRALPLSKFLLDIPEQDPFKFAKKREKKADYDGPRTLLVSDGEAAIIKYAKDIGIVHEFHVYHKNGKQLRLPKGAHDIQRANWLCGRLNAFFTKIGYVSTKYLPGFLTLFEFLHNCGTSPEAISRLFEILVTPGLGLGTKEDYARQFKTPNYYLEWGKGAEPLRKIPIHQLTAAYMRHLMLTKDEKITYRDIAEATGIKNYKTVNKIYNKIYSSGLIDLVCEKFSKQSKLKLQIDRHGLVEENDFLAFYLYVYDRCCKNLQLPPHERLARNTILAECEAEHKRKICQRTLLRYFKKIESEGLHPLKYSELSVYRSSQKRRPYGLSKRTIEIFETYIKLEKEFLTQHNYPPRTEYLKIQVSKMFDKCSPRTVEKILSRVRQSPQYEELAKKHNLPYKEKNNDFKLT